MNIFVGKVIHYFNRLGVAAIEIHREIKTGDTIILLGHTTDITQRICSMEIDHQKIDLARAGQTVAVQLVEPARPGDMVYKKIAGEEGMDNQGIWELMHETWLAIVPQYQPIFDRYVVETDLDGSTLGLLMSALSFYPQPVSADLLNVRNPYTAASQYRIRLENAADKGFIEQAAPGFFRLTDLGREEVELMMAEVRQAMAACDPLPNAASRCLADLLARLVQSCLDTPPPPDPWSIRLSSKVMPAHQPALPYIEQAITCLNAYRDDSHLAAWKPSGLSGPAMESLTLLWRCEANSINSLYHRMPQRGHSIAIYEAALNELRERDLVHGPDSQPQLTRDGRAFRAQVEMETDGYFFAPWNCLDAAERADLIDLITRLGDGLG